MAPSISKCAKTMERRDILLTDMRKRIIMNVGDETTAKQILDKFRMHSGFAIVDITKLKTWPVFRPPSEDNIKQKIKSILVCVHVMVHTRLLYRIWM